MKGIVSLQREGEPGKYHEVGMNNRTMVQAGKIRRVRKLADEWARGKPYRLEIFNGDSVQGEPNEVEYHGTPAMQAS